MPVCQRVSGGSMGTPRGPPPGQLPDCGPVVPPDAFLLGVAPLCSLAALGFANQSFRRVLFPARDVAGSDRGFSRGILLASFREESTNPSQSHVIHATRTGGFIPHRLPIALPLSSTSPYAIFPRPAVRWSRWLCFFLSRNFNGFAVSCIWGFRNQRSMCLQGYHPPSHFRCKDLIILL